MVACASEQGDTCRSVRLVGFKVEEDADREDRYEAGEVDVEMMWLRPVGSAREQLATGYAMV